jgi:K+-transporting ATPase KdpF subunit
MNPLYLITGVVALGLLLYLIFALVKPEWFE